MGEDQPERLSAIAQLPEGKSTWKEETIVKGKFKSVKAKDQGDDNRVAELFAEAPAQPKSQPLVANPSRKKKRQREPGGDEDAPPTKKAQRVLKREKSLQQAYETAKATASARYRNQKKEAQSLTRTIYVGNLPPKTNSKELRKLFSDCGVESTRIRSAVFTDPGLTKRQNYGMKNFAEGKSVTGYVVLKEEAGVAEALKLSGKTYKGNHLMIDREYLPLHEKLDGADCVFVGNIPLESTEENVWALFEKELGLGKVTWVRMPKDTKSGFGKGFAFVRFASPDSSRKALQLPAGKAKIKQRELRITPAKSQSTKKKQREINCQTSFRDRFVQMSEEEIEEQVEREALKIMRNAGKGALSFIKEREAELGWSSGTGEKSNVKAEPTPQPKQEDGGEGSESDGEQGGGGRVFHKKKAKRAAEREQARALAQRKKKGHIGTRVGLATLKHDSLKRKSTRQWEREDKAEGTRAKTKKKQLVADEGTDGQPSWMGVQHDDEGAVGKVAQDLADRAMKREQERKSSKKDVPVAPAKKKKKGGPKEKGPSRDIFKFAQSQQSSDFIERVEGAKKVKRQKKARQAQSFTPSSAKKRRAKR